MLLLYYIGYNKINSLINSLNNQKNLIKTLKNFIFKLLPNKSVSNLTNIDIMF